MKLSVIIVSFNTKKLLKECLNSVLRETAGFSLEIIVVDNASSDSSVEEVKKIQKKFKFVKLVENKKNLGFGKANNLGIRKALGEYILLLNSDTLVKDNVLFEIVNWMQKHPKVGISSCSLRNPDNTLQGTGGYFPTLTRVFSWMTIQDLPFVDNVIKPFHPMKASSFQKGEGFYKEEKELDWVTGAFFLIRKKVVDNVGYFDEDYFMYTEEVDFCFRAKELGWKVYYLPKWSITHIGGASGKVWSFVSLEFEGVKLFYKKHYPRWKYPILRFFLKIGALGRVFIFGLLKGKEAAKAYAKAFKMA